MFGISCLLLVISSINFEPFKENQSSFVAPTSLLVITDIPIMRASTTILDRVSGVFGKKITIVRPTLIYGSSDPHNGYGPNQFIRLAQAKKDLSLFGRGEEKRDHVNVNDVGNIIYFLVKVVKPIFLPSILDEEQCKFVLSKINIDPNSHS